MTQELDFRYSKVTFLHLCIKAMVPQDLKSYSQVFGVFFLGFREHENIIDEKNDKTM